MNRSEFLASAGTLLASALIPTTARAATADEAGAVRQLIIDDYYTYYVLQDPQRYRALLADDYLLLENGHVMDLAADMALIPKPEDDTAAPTALSFTRYVSPAPQRGWFTPSARTSPTARRAPGSSAFSKAPSCAAPADAGWSRSSIPR